MPRWNLDAFTNQKGLSLNDINLITNFYIHFDNGGAKQNIINVEPLFYQGLIGASEFLVYNSVKAYLCLSLFIGTVNLGVNANPDLIVLYNENDTAVQYLNNCIPVYNGAAIEYEINNVNIIDTYFFRILVWNNLYTSLTFNGYRITLI